MIILMVFLVLSIVISVLLLFKRNNRKSLRDKHVVVTGGSRGIGKSVAILAAREGADVTIIARNVDLLNEAAAEIRANALNNKKVTVLCLDVSDYSAVKKALTHLENQVGPIYMLVNCAGQAICGQVEDFSAEQTNHLINVNYLGTLYPIQFVVPKMKQRREGIIVLTASQLALLGMYGYSVYSSCKFALRGLAECIRMELKPYNVSVTLNLPPDTDTPGYKEENKTKPIETQLISQSAGLFQPEDVAKKLLEDALRGNFFSYIGFESFITATLCCGMTDFSSLFELLLQSVLMGPFRLIGAGYLYTFHQIVQKQFEKKTKVQ